MPTKTKAKKTRGRKAAKAKSPRVRRPRQDPLVPIDGQRVLTALRMAISGPASVNSFASLLRDHGVRISGPSLNDITLGRTFTTRRSVRDGIARFAGYPFHPMWLSGEAYDVMDAYAASADPTQQEVPTPIEYNVEAERLRHAASLALTRDWIEEEGRPQFPHLDIVKNGPSDDPYHGVFYQDRAPGTDYQVIIRKLISLPYWRSLLLANDPLEGLNQEDAAEFARGMAMAIRALFAPWLRDGVRLPMSHMRELFQQTTATLAALEARDDDEPGPA